jgi:hypothetical protein
MFHRLTVASSHEALLEATDYERNRWAQSHIRKQLPQYAQAVAAGMPHEEAYDKHIVQPYAKRHAGLPAEDHAHLMAPLHKQSVKDQVRAMGQATPTASRKRAMPLFRVNDPGEGPVPPVAKPAKYFYDHQNHFVTQFLHDPKKQTPLGIALQAADHANKSYPAYKKLRDGGMSHDDALAKAVERPWARHPDAATHPEIFKRRKVRQAFEGAYSVKADELLHPSQAKLSSLLKAALRARQ